ncbi:uncharacterized protein LOC127848292 [Dreissena polymorpha]|uniref:Uncharacterized protein n=1 Tax=Dreissena polymorpha TaxID=45954 RepID=A0A9D4I8H5_DREPO|nr:uncharacterized protein LOC127848292 [Dreissena polymorpha]KAH3752199.1 hypothetical protein DPMN_186812 [Dreissena polymorpha]
MKSDRTCLIVVIVFAGWLVNVSSAASLINNRQGERGLNSSDVNQADHVISRNDGGHDGTRKLTNNQRKDGSTIQQPEVDNESSARERRWADYDPNYDWENGGKDYVVPGMARKRKETKFEKFAKEWQKNSIKYIFLFSFLCMIVCCCLACCKRLCVRTYEVVCFHCRDWRDLCLNRDPTYIRARQFADDYGIKLDYDQYKKIKKSYEEGLKKQGYGSKIDLSGRGMKGAGR